VGIVVKPICVALTCLVLAGCGIAVQQQRAALKQQAHAAAEECKSRFPDDVANLKDRYECTNSAMKTALATYKYPDLLNVYMTYRIVIAERVQSGQLTLAEGKSLIAQKWSEIIAEEQQRNLANQVVEDQREAANLQLMATGFSMMANGR